MAAGPIPNVNSTVSEVRSATSTNDEIFNAMIESLYTDEMMDQMVSLDEIFTNEDEEDQ